MKQNIGTIDRVLRVLFAIVVGILYFTQQVEGTVALVLGIFALIFLLTSLVGFCPLYFLFKLSTKIEKN